jgi:acyl carrier protein
MQHIEQIVHAVLQQVGREKSLTVDELKNDAKLVDEIGFRSIDLARILAILELKLGIDPFASLVPITSVRTVADLCAAYAQCLAGNEAPQAEVVSPAALERAAGRQRGQPQQRDARKSARRSV